MNSHEVFIHIHQGCFTGTGAIVRLPQCQWSKPDGYGKISQCITTTKHSKAKTVCIFLGIYCILLKPCEYRSSLVLLMARCQANIGSNDCLFTDENVYHIWFIIGSIYCLVLANDMPCAIKWLLVYTDGGMLFLRHIEICEVVVVGGGGWCGMVGWLVGGGGGGWGGGCGEWLGHQGYHLLLGGATLFGPWFDLTGGRVRLHLSVTIGTLW